MNFPVKVCQTSVNNDTLYLKLCFDDRFPKIAEGHPYNFDIPWIKDIKIKNKSKITNLTIEGEEEWFNYEKIIALLNKKYGFNIKSYKTVKKY